MIWLQNDTIIYKPHFYGYIIGIQLAGHQLSQIPYCKEMCRWQVMIIDAGWLRLLATFGNLCSYIKWQLFANIYSLPEIAISDCRHSKWDRECLEAGCFLPGNHSTYFKPHSSSVIFPCSAFVQPTSSSFLPLPGNSGFIQVSILVPTTSV